MLAQLRGLEKQANMRRGPLCVMLEMCWVFVLRGKNCSKHRGFFTPSSSCFDSDPARAHGSLSRFRGETKKGGSMALGGPFSLTLPAITCMRRSAGWVECPMLTSMSLVLVVTRVSVPTHFCC